MARVKWVGAAIESHSDGLPLCSFAGVNRPCQSKALASSWQRNESTAQCKPVLPRDGHRPALRKFSR